MATCAALRESQSVGWEECEKRDRLLIEGSKNGSLE